MHVADHGSHQGPSPHRRHSFNCDDLELLESPLWQKSGFADLEALLLQYLVGSGPNNISESVRLKLQTPLAVADALLGASQQQLQGDLASAEKV